MCIRDSVLGIAFRRINRPQKVSDAGTKSEIEGSEGSLSDLFDIAKRLLRREGYSEKKDFVIPDHLDDKSKTILGSYYRFLYLGSKTVWINHPLPLLRNFNHFCLVFSM